MTDPIDASRKVADERRRNARRFSDPEPPPQLEGERINLPVVIDAPVRHEPEPEPQAGPAVFAAQIMGQEGQKRGLRGGAPVLNQARAAYLEAEYSGATDRRPPAGLVKKAEI